MDTSKCKFGVVLLTEDRLNHCNDLVSSKKFNDPQKAYSYAYKVLQTSIWPYLQDCFAPRRCQLVHTLRILSYTEHTCFELACFRICA